ncbi:MAG: transposase [Rhodospirillaceae bacterium]|nr:transposase [Rhodospirillaceae bacterium]
MAWTEAIQAKHGRVHDDRQNDLTDAERDLISPLIPTQGRMGRPRATDPRRVFDAIRSMLSSGCQWRAIPKCFPPFTTGAGFRHRTERSGARRL